MKRLPWVLAACLAVFTPAGPARADVIYSNLGPGESYVQDRGWAESGPNTFIGTTRTAIAFTVSTDTLFDSARLALGLARGANEIEIRLYNSAGVQPGTVIETMHLSGQMPRLGMFGSGHLLTLQSALHPVLQASGTYWLLPFASGDTLVAWNYNDQVAFGPSAFSNQREPVTWTVTQQLQGAFEVNGTPSPAPEPSTLALAGVGLVGVVGYLWRKSRKPAVA
jgi:hypothetical protein